MTHQPPLQSKPVPMIGAWKVHCLLPELGAAWQKEVKCVLVPTKDELLWTNTCSGSSIFFVPVPVCSSLCFVVSGDRCSSEARHGCYQHPYPKRHAPTRPQANDVAIIGPVATVAALGRYSILPPELPERTTSLLSIKVIPH